MKITKEKVKINFRTCQMIISLSITTIKKIIIINKFMLKQRISRKELFK